MMRNPLVGEAFALAADVHRRQYDKADAPYMLHPVEVMNRATELHMRTSDGWRLAEVQATALLHDALEDIEGEQVWDRDKLSDRIRDLDERTWQAVKCLTKQPSEPYANYLERVEADWISRIVKIADLSHNLDAFRIPAKQIQDRDFERWDKYHRAVVRLTKGFHSVGS